MGRNLTLNILDHNFSVAVFDADHEGLARLKKESGNSKKLMLAESIPDVVRSLTKPRIILLMIPAGEPTDMTIKLLLPFLANEDIIIDGGNSNPGESQRRYEILEKEGFNYIGMGVSGGEMGARNGPSLMPGGSKRAWKEVERIFTTISAKTSDGTPCCEWMGPGNAGHFVKMVHNGIEYAIMQAISDVYLLMRDLLDLNYEQIASIFGQWGKENLDSYLLDISSKILLAKEKDGNPAVDNIIPVADQKGTGSWATQYALDLGVPANLLSAAVFSRNLSVYKENLNIKILSRNSNKKNLNDKDLDVTVINLMNALYLVKLAAFEQGFRIIETEKNLRKWNVSLEGIAGCWREGCILRSKIIEEIQSVLADKKSTILLVENILGASFSETLASLRYVTVLALQNRVPLPALSSALQYFDSLRYESLPFNLVQAQRDCFGSHGYSRKDFPKTSKFHRDWLGSGEESEM